MRNDIVILIPHYNNPVGLESSLNSVAFPIPIHVLVVDDGSHTKPDEERLRKLFEDRLSISFLYNRVNEGIERTLNNGLRYIQEQLPCQYIARLDCGDTCAPSRFVKQKQYLDAHPDVYLIGSWVEFVDEQGEKVYTYKAPADHKDIVKNMYLKCSFIHPSVMFRAAALKEIGPYPINYKAAEDYAFFFRFVQRYKTHIIPEVLTYCEINPAGISHTKRNVQLRSKIRILMDNKTASPYFVAGLFRNLVLRALPYSLVSKAKAILLK